MNEVLPPQSLDSEESVLGAMMLSSNAIEACVDITFGAEAFYRESHGEIFKAILSLYAKGEPVDALTVIGELDKRGNLKKAGGAERVHELAAIVPAVSNAGHHAQIVRAMWIKRELIRAGNEITALGYDGQGSLSDILLEADQRMLKIQGHATQKGDRVFTGKELVAEYRETLANPLNEDEIGARPPFSFLSPLMGSRLYVLGGYTGDGKTAMALQFLASACEGGARVGFHSIEMSRTDLTHRLVSSFGAPYHDVRTGHVSSIYRPVVDKALETIEGWDWEVIDDEEVDPSQVRRDQRAGKYDLLIIDHLHRIRIKDRRHAREELEENVRQITNIAKEFNIPVLLLAQLSREEKRNPFPRPTKASLKGSGSIEQEAAHVWFVYRLRDENQQPTSDGEFIIEKNRYGGLGFKNLFFRASQVRFTETQN